MVPGRLLPRKGERQEGEQLRPGCLEGVRTGQDHLAQGDRGDFPAPERLRRGLAFLPELRDILSPEGPEGGHHPLQGQRAGIELPEGPASAQDTGGGRRRPGRKRKHIQNQGHSQ